MQLSHVNNLTLSLVDIFFRSTMKTVTNANILAQSPGTQRGPGAPTTQQQFSHIAALSPPRKFVRVLVFTMCDGVWRAVGGAPSATAHLFPRHRGFLKTSPGLARRSVRRRYPLFPVALRLARPALLSSYLPFTLVGPCLVRSPSPCSTHMRMSCCSPVAVFARVLKK